MGKTISIRFKDNKVVKVSGGSKKDHASAAQWAQAFADGAIKPRVLGEPVREKKKR